MTLVKTLSALDQMLEVLGTEAGGSWRPEEIILFGFSQGGTTAMEWALHQGPVFGGTVAVAAGLLEERQWKALWPPPVAAQKSDTDRAHAAGSRDFRRGDCVMIAGKRDSVISPRWAKASASIFSAAVEESRRGSVGKGGTGPGQVVSLAFFDKGHGMLGSPAEARAVMEFIAPRLHRRGAWEMDPDVVEVGPAQAGHQ